MTRKRPSEPSRESLRGMYSLSGTGMYWARLEWGMAVGAGIDDSKVTDVAR